MIRKLTILAFALLLSGCATVNPMAFDKSSKTIDVTQKSILLMTLDVTRSEPSRYVPNPFVVRLQKPDAKDKKDRQNFKLDTNKDVVKDGDRKIFLVRMAIEPGEYELANVGGLANAFPFNGLFDIPLRMNLTVKPGSVVYLGRVVATLRPKKDGEFRAGPVIPLIDQAATGISTSTWDVLVDDQSRRDVELFRNAFPALQDTSIDSALLPAFDRDAIQRWWDGEEAKQQPAGSDKVASSK